jgi:DNA-binding transcriptional ArsR family regulator
MKLINNEIVDFIFAMYHFANRNKQSEINYPGIPELKVWCSEYEKKLSPFLLNDISLIIEKMVFPSIYLFMLHKNNPGLETVEEFLFRLKQIKTEEFLEYIQTEFLDGRKEELTIDVLQDIFINEGLHPGYDPSEEAELLHVLLQDPENFLERLHKTYSDFYKLAYKQGRISLKDLNFEKLQWHQNRLEEGPEKYLEQLGLSSFISSLSENGEPILYFSLFSDTTISSFWNSRTVIIGAGTDQRIINRSARVKTDDFFSCFGDPKRLEILRLTAKRPWYSTELANHFEIKPATLSYHINILVDAELLHLVKGESRRFYYTLNKKSIKEYLGFVSQDLLGLDYKV